VEFRPADRGPEKGHQPLALVSLDARQGVWQALDRFDHFLALTEADDNFVHGHPLLSERQPDGAIGVHRSAHKISGNRSALYDHQGLQRPQ
jgi:hypothetical protein